PVKSFISTPIVDLPAVATAMAPPPTPFLIAEDGTSTMPTPKSSPTNPVFAAITSNTTSPTKGTQTTDGILVEEDTTIKTQFSYKTCEERTIHGEECGFADTSVMSVEDANIDDSCYSAFSEVPNDDMTAFARLGQRSPTKLSFNEQKMPRSS